MITHGTVANKAILGILVLAMAFTFSSCAKKITFLNSAIVPAARGTVQVKKDNNNNYAIKLELFNLAEVSRLQPARHAYIVWLITDQQQAKNLGQINSASARFTKKLKASFETVTAFKPTKIFVTAEDEAAVQYPGNMVVLTTGGF